MRLSGTVARAPFVVLVILVVFVLFMVVYPHVSSTSTFKLPVRSTCLV
jgi:hypothetical protein